MSTVRRKRVTRKKAPARYPRAKAVKTSKSVKASSKTATRQLPTRKRPAPPNFDLLRAAHRGQMGEVLAVATADRLREIAQVVGLTQDTSRRDGTLPAPVIKAMTAADTSLLEQIDALENFGLRTSQGPVGLPDAIERAIAGSDPHLGSCHVTFQVELPLRLPPVASDPGDINEILFALLVNAREAVANRRNATIRISAIARSDAIELVVEDDGPGLPASLRKRLFDAFVTGHATGEHLGLGLAVARQLARNHGGDLQLVGTTKGARFVLLLRRWKVGKKK